jgi:hypothetical protein
MSVALIKHYLEIETMKIVFISDNSELIRRLKVHKQYDEPYPNQTLKSEFDGTKQIYRTTTTYGIFSIYKWMRGHQDKNAAYNDLVVETQLNVDADKFAGDFQLAKGKTNSIIAAKLRCNAINKRN